MRDGKLMEQKLSKVLSEFARTLATDFPIQGILDHLVGRIVDVLPVTAAGVTLISPGTNPRYVAASNASALRFEALQTELGEGPCLAAYETGEPVAIPDLRLNDQFPVFSPRALAEGLVAVFTFPLRHGDDPLGALDLYRTTAGPLSSEEMAAAQTLADVAAAYLLNAQARADLERSTDLAREISLHDPLTGLPNRTLLVQRLEHAVRRCRRSGKMVAVLYADLDKFKDVNDNFGHHTGDELLRAVAHRLSGLLRPGDTLARLAGDEFVVLCEDLDDASPVEPLAARVGKALNEPFTLSHAEVRISASVGIAFAGRGDDIPEQLLRDADTAMYQIKRKGGDRHGVVDLREARRARRQSVLMRDLPGALRGGGLRTAYQAIVSVADDRIVGVEALIRWTHPTLGIVAPEAVISLAEKAGMITAVGRWVFTRACLDLHRWQLLHHRRAFEMAVNVSAHQLMAPDFADLVDSVLTETHTDPADLILEVTESVFIADSERAVVVLNDLKTLGVRLALDDFGTGYSSLSYLNRFPVDIVKIDQSFIATLDREPTSRSIVKAMIGLAHDLDMTVIAEGIETASQHAEAVALRCDYYQGFYFARPISSVDLDPVLAGLDDRRHVPPRSA